MDIKEFTKGTYELLRFMQLLRFIGLKERKGRIKKKGMTKIMREQNKGN